jgi:exodeoxyribonuclease V beta subunit
VAMDLHRHLVALIPRVAPVLAGDSALLDALVPALHLAIATPLGPDFDEIRLRDVPRRDRLDELNFELPLVGPGWQSGGSGRATGGLGRATGGSGELTVAAIAERIEHWLPPDDILAGYPQQLARLDAGEGLRGYLTGSIDAVLRLRPPGKPADDGRFVVVDYKSNRLAVRGDPLSAWHYRPAAMATAMREAHYPLQALLYSVALHRYLRARLVGYRPQTHLGGVLYLFVRGMAGPDTPRVEDQPCGVFIWHPPTGLILELSDLMDQGMPLDR